MIQYSTQYTESMSMLELKACAELISKGSATMLNAEEIVKGLLRANTIAAIAVDDFDNKIVSCAFIKIEFRHFDKRHITNAWYSKLEPENEFKPLLELANLATDSEHKCVGHCKTLCSMLLQVISVAWKKDSAYVYATVQESNKASSKLLVSLGFCNEETDGRMSKVIESDKLLMYTKRII